MDIVCTECPATRFILPDGRRRCCRVEPDAFGQDIDGRTLGFDPGVRIR